MKYKELLQMLKDNVTNAVRLKNEDAFSFLRYCQQQKYYQKLIVTVNVTEGMTELRKEK